MVEDLVTLIARICHTIVEFTVIGQSRLGGIVFAAYLTVDVFLVNGTGVGSFGHLNLHVMKHLEMVLPGTNPGQNLAAELTLDDIVGLLVFLQLLIGGTHLHAELAQVDDVWPFTVLSLGLCLSVAVLWLAWLSYRDGFFHRCHTWGFLRQFTPAESHLLRQYWYPLAWCPWVDHL